MKFDLDTAWRDTRRYLTENAGLLAIMAGIFVFLPYAAIQILMPLVAEMPVLPEGANLQVVMDAMQPFYARTWWMLLLVLIIVTIGQLAMLALLGRKPHPTVGEAIGIGGKAILPVWLAILLQWLGINFVVLLIISIALATGMEAVVSIAGITGLLIAAYLWIRFSLVLPLASIEGDANPLHLLTGSWKRTKGHALRILGFFVLIGIAAIVLALVFTMVTGAVLALFGAAVAETIGDIISAMLVAALIVLFTAVLAAVHVQLRRLAQSGDITGPHTAPRD